MRYNKMDAKPALFVTGAIISVVVIGVVVIAWIIYAQGSIATKHIKKGLRPDKNTFVDMKVWIDPIIKPKTKSIPPTAATEQLKLTCKKAWKLPMSTPKTVAKSYWDAQLALPQHSGYLQCTFNAHPTDASWTMSYMTGVENLVGHTEKIQLLKQPSPYKLNNSCQRVFVDSPLTNGCVRGTLPDGKTIIVYNNDGVTISYDGLHKLCTSCGLG
jgi:hypothetical protein